jgi:hypothetical protein
MDTVSWLLDSLPSLRSLALSKWNISPANIAKLRLEAKINNLDIEYT